MEINKPHSKLGIASCVIGIAMFLLFLMTTLLYYLQMKVGFNADSNSIAVFQMFIEIRLPMSGHIIGLILGVVSLFLPNRKKLFPILGVAANLIFASLIMFFWWFVTFYLLD
jgi:hypothetical protein